MTNKDAIILLKDCIRMFENGKDRTAEKALVYLEQHIEALNIILEMNLYLFTITRRIK